MALLTGLLFILQLTAVNATALTAYVVVIAVMPSGSRIPESTFL